MLGFSIGLTFAEATEKQYGFRTKLALLADELAKHKKGLLLLIDEIQATSPEMRELATTYQQLVGDGKNVAIAMAGLPHAISSVLNDDVLTFLNRAKKFRLGSIDLPKISLFYSESFEKIGISISAEDIMASAKATRGYPYLLQLIGYYLVQYAGESKTIDAGTTKLAINSAVEDLVGSIHKPCLKPLTKSDFRFLNAMIPDSGPSMISDIKTRLNVSQGTVQSYRRRLIDAGVIASEQWGTVEMIVPYLREYLNGDLMEYG